MNLLEPFETKRMKFRLLDINDISQVNVILCCHGAGQIILASNKASKVFAAPPCSTIFSTTAL